MHRLLQLRPLHAHSFALLAILSGLTASCTSPIEPKRQPDPTAGAQALREGNPGAATWSPVVQLTIVPASAANLPGGKVMLWSAADRFGFGARGRTYTVLFDPKTGEASPFAVAESPHEAFCTGTTNLADGRVLVNGGTDEALTSLYDPLADTWTRGPDMVIPRSYNANTLLQDGSVFTLGGSWYDKGGSKDGEVWTPTAGWRRLSRVPVTPMLTADPEGVYRSDNHMWLFAMGNGRVLHAGPSAQMNWIDTTGDGEVISAGLRGDDVDSMSGNAVMYDIGKILKVGGGLTYAGSEASASAYVIDGNGPLTVTKLPPMAYARVFQNSVVLPNGQVVIIGGQSATAAFSDYGAILAPELWNPATGTFTVLPAMTVPRNYHSVALLLRDGRVMAAGGGLCGAECAANHGDIEILTPPYLLNQNGTRAVQPVITSPAPAAPVAYGSTLNVTTDVPVTAFSLVRLSSTTHTVNNDQRRVPVSFQNPAGNDYIIQIPTNPGVALPGMYMLFALDETGVPSEAIDVIINGASTPRLTSPGDQEANVDTQATLNLVAVDPAGNPITFAATGLPPQLGINAATGAIIGTPSTAGTYAVTVSASNAAGQVSTNFTWRVFPSATGNQPPAIVQPTAQASAAGQSISLAIVATDPNGDAITYSASGLPPGLTINSTTGVISGGVNAAGVYQVVVIAQDAVGFTSTATFTWTALAPTSNITPQEISPVLAGVSRTFTAQATGDNLRYRWRFGDGTPQTAFSTLPTIDYTFANPGIYRVTLEVETADQRTSTHAFLQAVVSAVPENSSSRASSPIVHQLPPYDGRLWVVNPDTNTVTAFVADTYTKLAEVAVGVGPSSVAPTTDGSVWVVNRDSATISVIGLDFLVRSTINLPPGSRPFGIVFSAAGDAYVTLEATGQVVRLNGSGDIDATAAVGPNPRSISYDRLGDRLLVSRFITPALPGESTNAVQTASGGAEVVVIPLATFGAQAAHSTVVLQHSDRTDSTTQGRGIPNYLGAAAISPDGTTAWVPSKQDNIKRGMLRDQQQLNFQNTVRAITSRISLTTLTEQPGARVDYDDSGVASAAVYHPTGAYLFVALETSREIAVVDPVTGIELFRSDVGRAPQGLAVAPDGQRLFVSNFMDRTLSVLDLRPLLKFGSRSTPRLASVNTTATETLSDEVLLGKQLFYDARDPRLARDGYISCASCHRDGEQDGRTWDMTGFGEGLRNTISLRGRGTGHGRRHWTGNFDEVQDFEGQIRTLSGGLGLMTSVQFMTGTRQNPMGDAKAGVSADLDALAAYVNSLTAVPPSPKRTPTGALTPQAVEGRSLFIDQCAHCHGGPAFSDSSRLTLTNVATIKPSSGKRLGLPLTGLLEGLDTPTLRDAWATAPYLHDGSAATIAAAIVAHAPGTLTAAQIEALSAFVEQIDGQEPAMALAVRTQFIRLEQVSEVSGAPLASMSELQLMNADGTLLPRLGWVASANSEELVGGNYAASNALDGNINTMWHTQWTGTGPPAPYWFVVNLGAPISVGGFRYLPRQDMLSNGTFAQFKLSASADGVVWGNPIEQGDFTTLGQINAEKVVLFK